MSWLLLRQTNLDKILWKFVFTKIKIDGSRTFKTSTQQTPFTHVVPKPLEIIFQRKEFPSAYPSTISKPCWNGNGTMRSVRTVEPHVTVNNIKTLWNHK